MLRKLPWFGSLMRLPFYVRLPASIFAAAGFLTLAVGAGLNWSGKNPVALTINASQTMARSAPFRVHTSALYLIVQQIAEPDCDLSECLSFFPPVSWAISQNGRLVARDGLGPMSAVELGNISRRETLETELGAVKLQTELSYVLEVRRTAASPSRTSRADTVILARMHPWDAKNTMARAGLFSVLVVLSAASLIWLLTATAIESRLKR